MRRLSATAAFLVAAWVAAPAMGQDRPNMSGNWQFDASKSELRNIKMASATWVIEESDNSIHITESEGAKSKKTEWKCTTDGKECQVAGDKAKASFWYNGPMLVEMETKGDHVTRYRLTVSDDGKNMKVEMTHIVPQLVGADVLMFSKL